MSLIDGGSLAATLDAVNEALFFGHHLPKTEYAETARWIAARQGLPGSYAGMFAPTQQDFANGIRLFTGERIATRAGTSHILGEEACRALLLLEVHSTDVTAALQRASDGIRARLGEPAPGQPVTGRYCCGKCSAALWRHLAVGGLGGQESRLAAAMRELKASRTEDGQWRSYPLFYTLSALCEIALPGAVTELRYAAPGLERYLRRPLRDDPYAARRRAVAERALARC
jgi:hypothetical protein